MADERDAISKKEVARAIGWLDGFDNDGLEFSCADYSKANKKGVIRLEGRKGDLLVDVTVKITEVYVRRDDDTLAWLDDEDEDDE